MTSTVPESQTATFAALAAGRTDLKSLLPEQVWCYMLDASHPSVVAAHGACENYYSTNTGASERHAHSCVGTLLAARCVCLCTAAYDS